MGLLILYIYLIMWIRFLVPKQRITRTFFTPGNYRFYKNGVSWSRRRIASLCPYRENVCYGRTVIQKSFPEINWVRNFDSLRSKCGFAANYYFFCSYTLNVCWSIIQDLYVKIIASLPAYVNVYITFYIAMCLIWPSRRSAARCDRTYCPGRR